MSQKSSEVDEDLKRRVEQDKDLKTRFELEVRDKNRLETFVDGVFAIAITLLVLDFVIPVLPHSNVAIIGYIDSLLPKFVGYFLAFFLLGILLNNHSRQFRNLEYADQTLWWLNLVFLSFIVLVPFVTSIWTEYGDTTIGVLFFHFDMFISGLLLYFNWSYVQKHKYLLRKDITSRSITIINYRNLSIPIASFIAIVFAFLTPLLSNVAYLLILVIMFITPILIKRKK
ncbi:TMEM175 family protein [Methanobacterium oryzae]|uniref:TMEM175 family protein n=1 Tax=Methanobacterium oryzae TaxID=69540 RepID=UPI003D1CDC89